MVTIEHVAYWSNDITFLDKFKPRIGCIGFKHLHKLDRDDVIKLISFLKDSLRDKD